MKKLCLMVAAIAFAAVVHGTTVQWGGYALDPSADIENNSLVSLAEGTQAFLVFATAAIEPTSGATFDGSMLMNGDTVIAKVESSHKMTASDASETFSITSTYVKDYTAANGYYAILIANNANAPTAYSFYAYDQVKDVTAQKPIVDLYVEDHLTKDGWTVSAAGAGGGGTIPEPTSGLLLALGGAILALRRKHA